MTGCLRPPVPVAVACFALLALASPSTPMSTAFPGEKLFFQGDSASRTLLVESGQNVVLNCEAAGRPSPSIRWIHDGVHVQQGGDGSNGREKSEIGPLELSSTKARLFIDCADESDAGVYTCVAHTASMTITQTTTVIVGRPSVSSTNHQCVNKRIVSGVTGLYPEPARVYLWTSLRLEAEGYDVHLFCRAEGTPRPLVYWLDPNGQRIHSDSENYKVLDNGDLLIRNVNWESNMGEYSCVTENSAGKDKVETFIYPTRM